GARLLVAVQRLLRLARVARAQDQRVRAGPGGQLVAAHDRDRRAGAAAYRGGLQVAADRRAAHSADDQPEPALLPRDAGRLDAPQRVADLMRLREDVVDHAAGI